MCVMDSENSVAQPLTKEKPYARTETHSNRSVVSASGLYRSALQCFLIFKPFNLYSSLLKLAFYDFLQVPGAIGRCGTKNAKNNE